MFERMLACFAESFPFTPFSDGELLRVEKRLGVTIPTLVKMALTSLGGGKYWLTGQFFVLDVDLNLTEGVKKSLSVLDGQYDKVKSGEFDFEPVPYVWNGRELVIGCSEYVEYFIDCDDSPDPFVYCHLTDVGVSRERRRFSEVVKGFRYFENPREIPQYLIDFHWFESQVGFGDTLNPDLHHRMVRKWIAAGREGIPERLLNHPDSELNLELGDTSIFSPAYLN